MKTGVFVFIEAIDFTSAVRHYFGDEVAYAEFQNELVADPERGGVIPGASPLRKVRWFDKRRGLGKRGGLRIIYIHIPEIQVLFLMDVYGKDEAEDLSAKDKKILRELSRELVEGLKERYARGKL